MNNEPVAYVTGVRQFDPVMADTVLKVGTPLYTHQAPQPMQILDDGRIVPVFKTLTNEEIKQVWAGIRWDGNDPIELTFAKAILKRAQEK